jgi:D-alanine-D-alanine ligase
VTANEHSRVRDASAFGRVAVLMGGASAERAISLLSGGAVLEALLARGVNAEAVDPSVDGALERLARGEFDRVFNILHGRGGEDGVIQGYLDTLELPYTGSGVLGSALSMDKLRTKQIWQSAGLPTPAFAVLSDAGDLETAARHVGFPMMIKPVHEGSSIGMTKVASEEQLESAWRAADEFDRQVLAERWITGPEYTAGILGRDMLPLIRLETPREFYDYEAKYQADSTRYHCPCGLDADTESSLQALSMEAFDLLGASGWGRVDFICDDAGQPWLIEVNTVPGMTDHSLVPMAAKVAGVDMAGLVWRILETSVKVN